MIPRDTHDGAFYRAVLALHQDLFSLAQQVIILFIGIPKFGLRCSRLQSFMEKQAVVKQLAISYELPNNVFFMDILDLGDRYFQNVLTDSSGPVLENIRMPLSFFGFFYFCASFLDRQDTRIISAEVLFYKALIVNFQECLRHL